MQPDPHYLEQLTALVSYEHSRSQAELIANVLGESRAARETALWMMRHSQQPIPQKVSWPIFLAVENSPENFVPYAGLICEWLPNLDHAAEFRNMSHALTLLPIPEDKLASMLDTALAWIMDPKVLAATRANCMDIAYKISENEPELLRELALAIQAAMLEGSASIQARGRKFLKKIEKRTSK